MAGLIAFGCGGDESLGPPPPATAPTSGPSTSETIGVNLCGAFWELLGAPGMAERVCALQVTDPLDGAAITQCKLCAASLTFAERLVPEPACYGTIDDCPVGDADVTACFGVIGHVLADSVSGCNLDTPQPVDTTQLALRIATSSCGPVLLACKPLQELVAGLLATR